LLDIHLVAFLFQISALTHLAVLIVK